MKKLFSIAALVLGLAGLSGASSFSDYGTALESYPGIVILGSYPDQDYYLVQANAALVNGLEGVRRPELPAGYNAFDQVSDNGKYFIERVYPQ